MPLSGFRRESRPQEKPFTTPWRWVPEDLPASDDEGEGEPTPPNGHRPSRDGPSSTQYHHTSSASQQTSSYPPQHPKSQQPSGAREMEQYRSKGIKSPPIRESDQRRPDTQPPQATSPPSRDGHVSSSSATVYPSSRRNAQEHTPPKDSSLYRSSSRRNAQEYTPPSDSSPHRSSSRRRPQEYTPPSDDRSRRERERDREREKERRRGSDSDEQEHEAFSGKKELHPTFSPAIVRTPKYYSERTSTPSNATPTKSSSTRRASDGLVAPSHGAVLPSLTRLLQESVPSVLSPLIGATPRPSSATMPGLDKVTRDEVSSSSSSSSPPSSKDRVSRSQSRNHSRSNSLSNVDNKPHRSLQRSDTITSRTMSPTRYDERPHPPTYYSSSSSASMQQSSRTVGRSQTYPTLGPVSENPYSSTRRDSRDGRESRNPPASISRASDAVKDLAQPNNRTVGRSYTDPQLSYNPTRATSPLRSRSPTRALSPRSATPSRSSSRVPSRSHTPTSSAVIAPPVPVPPLPVDASHRYRTSSSAPRKAKVRKGYWNRHGDCLTHDRKYFVRAPREYRYPKEFSYYPERDFFRYDGKRIIWTPEIRESPDSLPMHGRSPKYPFESVRGSFLVPDHIPDPCCSSFSTQKSTNPMFGGDTNFTPRLMTVDFRPRSRSRNFLCICLLFIMSCCVHLSLSDAPIYDTSMCLR